MQIRGGAQTAPAEVACRVGKVTGQVFERLSIRKIGQLRQMPINTLNDLFGSAGEHYWQLAHGIDDRRVVPDREAQSISNETTFAADISDMEVLRAWLVELVDQVAQSLRRHDLKGRTVELKVRFADFKTISRSLTLAEPSSVTQELLDAGIDLLTKRLPPRHLPVRLLGFGVNKLDDSGTSQQQLFDQPEPCEQAGVSPASFYHWQRKFRASDRRPAQDAARSTPLVPVRIVNDRVAELTLELPHGLRLRLPQDCDAATLGRILQAALAACGERESC